MEGDADGNQDESIEVDANEIEGLKPMLLALECCNAAYPNGRGGYDEYYGLLEYDAFFNSAEPDESYYDDFDNETLATRIKEMNPDGYVVEHPYDSNGCATSFDGYSLTYVDDDGNKSPVKITFNEKELARIEVCRKFFK